MKNESHRIATWWMHWRDLNWPDQDNYESIKRRAEGFAKADVSAAMFFGAHFRWDFMPFFPILHDYIATVAEELHKYNIKLFDHHSVNLVHRYSTREEMRHVMQHSLPHLPFSPTREAAASWEYNGTKLNDWRMIDVKTNKPLFFPQHTADGFCHRNPDFKAAYQAYAKYLISETGIDGLSADDAMYFMHFNACGCPHCRAELKKRAGIDLPPVDDTSFWGNWDNPDWLKWIDLRFDASGEFYEDLRKVLPDNFVLTGCGSSSANAKCTMSSADARTYLRGWNYVNMEMSGNMPPYKHDPLTSNVPIANRIVNSSHHQAAAREKDVRAFCTGFAHSTESANHVWAVCKMLGADAWIGTLKTRLGLPWSITDTLPNEQDIVGNAFGFEKNHPELFEGEFVGQVGVFFSYETRNHTLYGTLSKGYSADYAKTLKTLFRNGLCPHTIFTIPENTEKYPIIILSGAARMTDKEISDVKKYLSSGGKIVVMGATPLFGDDVWKLKNRVDIPNERFFTSVPDGIHVELPKWMTSIVIDTPDVSNEWQEPEEGIFYNPCRLDKSNEERLVALCREYGNKMPIKVTEAKGYLSTTLENKDRTVIQFIAEDFDVDIDHKLDSIRNHRTRVNLLTKIAPIGIDGVIRLESSVLPQVYTPFCDGESKIELDNGICTVTLPDKCSYAILSFKK